MLAPSVVALLLMLGPARPPAPIPETTRQVVFVTTAGWAATDGVLQRYSRGPNGPWTPVGEPVPTVVGRGGLGWGIGLHGAALPEGPVKAEGDGRAPAGVFRLSAAFGYAEAVPTGLPYVATPGLHCVDDRASASYNLVRNVPPDRDWESHETMRRRNGLYRIGAVVAHNGPGVDAALLPEGARLGDAAPVPGGGSCIFLHVWRGPGTSTAGCTAMPDAQLAEVLAWLDAEADPVLVQLPEAEAAALRGPWGLP
jgi:L,D-peptidoglycan transpeptidase YkuD (ErfK/YbiS/YcfS/YnhG family)